MTERKFFVQSDVVEVSGGIEMHNVVKHGETGIPGFQVSAATKEMINDALLDAPSWLPFAAERYNISPDIRDYVIMTVPIMPSDLPNRNNVAFPYSQLTAFNTDSGMIAYKTWKGKPMHVEHCFPKSTLITTYQGQKRIKDIKVGDSVLTHKGRYKKVVKLYKNGKKPLKYVEPWGTPSYLIATENHPVYVVDRRQIFETGKYGGGTTRGFNVQISLSDDDIKPHFRPISDIYTGDYLVTPITCTGKTKVKSEFAFLAGVYAAEGSFEKYKDKDCAVIFTIGFTEKDYEKKIVECCDKLNLKYSCYHYGPSTGRNVRQIRISSYEFANQMRNLIGEYSRNKYISPEILSWDKESLKWFLGGMIEGDGCASNCNFRYITTSLHLAKGFIQILAYLGISTSCSSNRTKQEINRLSKGIEESSYGIKYGITTSPLTSYKLNKYTVRKKVNKGKSNDNCGGLIFSLLTDSYILNPIKRVVDTKERQVYNFEVEDDNSYVANGFIVHNCNKDYTKAKGVILDSALRPMKGYKGNLWKVLCLGAIDRTRDVVLANQIMTGERPCYSMGAFCNDYTCSICGASLAEKGGCPHLMKGDPTYKMVDNKVACWNIFDMIGYELSNVASPAYLIAEQNTDELITLD